MLAVGTRVQQFGEHELLQRADHSPGSGLQHRPHLVDEEAGQYEPAQPQPGGEGLAGRARVHDAFGSEGLHRADGCAVEAELPVVVVLDHEKPLLGRSREFGAAVRCECHPCRVLMGGGHHHGRVGEVRHPKAVAIDVHPGDGEARRGGDVAMDPQRRVLERQPRQPLRVQRGGEQRQTVRVPGADDDPVGAGHHATGAAQVVGQRLPQRGGAEGIGQVERRDGCPGQHPAGRGQPGAPRERREVGPSGEQAPPWPLDRRWGDGGVLSCPSPAVTTVGAPCRVRT